MKKIASAVLGLSFALATVGISLAAQTTPAPATSDNSAKPAVVKKHVKRTKKAPMNSTTPTPAPAASK